MWENLRDSSLAFCFAVLLLLALFAPVICGGQETQSQPSPTLSGASPTPGSGQSGQTPSWSSLDQLLAMLETEAGDSQRESMELLNALVRSRTEVNELSRLLDLSERSLTDLGQSMTNEREQAAEALGIALERGAMAEASRDRWKAGALIGGALAVAGWAFAALAVAF